MSKEREGRSWQRLTSRYHGYIDKIVVVATSIIIFWNKCSLAQISFGIKMWPPTSYDSNGLARWRTRGGQNGRLRLKKHNEMRTRVFQTACIRETWSTDGSGHSINIKRWRGYETQDRPAWFTMTRTCVENRTTVVARCWKSCTSAITGGWKGFIFANVWHPMRRTAEKKRRCTNRTYLMQY